MLCEQCVLSVISKLVPNDIFILNQLKDKVVPLAGVTRGDLSKALNDLMSDFQIQQALMRMDLIGFVGSQQQGRIWVYHITPDGLLALEYLKSV